MTPARVTPRGPPSCGEPTAPRLLHARRRVSRLCPHKRSNHANADAPECSGKKRTPRRLRSILLDVCFQTPGPAPLQPNLASDTVSYPHSMKPPGFSVAQSAWGAAIVLWGAGALSVWAWTTQYEFKAPSVIHESTAAKWPAETRLPRAADRPTLLFFIHPRCPCTRASVRELERTLTGAGLSRALQPKLIIVASLPANASGAWRNTDTLRRASALPRAETWWDVDGREAGRFGAQTSGTAMLYSQAGRLLFAGGVTVSRGHDGDNAGCDRLYALLTRQTHARQEPTPVFGCSLCVGSEAPDCREPCHDRQPCAAAANEGALH